MSRSEIFYGFYQEGMWIVWGAGSLSEIVQCWGFRVQGAGHRVCGLGVRG